jgi:hypothetical protein
MDTLAQSLSSSLPKVKPIYSCSFCKLIYEQKWIKKNILCLFCSQFRTPLISRFALLKEIEWFFIQSGENDPHSFYTELIHLIHRWCNHFQLPHTTKEIQLEHDILYNLNIK